MSAPSSTTERISNIADQPTSRIKGRPVPPLMLSIVLSALAAPPTPALAATPAGGASISVLTGSRADHLRQSGCDEGDQCDALSRQSVIGGALSYRPLAPFSLYGSLWHDSETVRAAEYAGTGWGGSGGLIVGKARGPLSGASGWIGLSGARTDNLLTSQARASRSLDLGGVLYNGSAYDGIIAWAGAGASLTLSDTLTLNADSSAADSTAADTDTATDTADGTTARTFDLDLARRLPVYALGGFEIYSDALNPWSEKGRLGFGADLQLGGELSITARLSFSY